MVADFFAFSLVAFAFFPLVTKSLKDRPDVVERLTRGYLAVLAICDVRFILAPKKSRADTHRSNSEILVTRSTTSTAHDRLVSSSRYSRCRCHYSSRRASGQSLSMAT